MTKFKVGDAVRTPSGSVARIRLIDEDGKVHLGDWIVRSKDVVLTEDMLTRLVPEDKTLAAKVRCWWAEWSSHSISLNAQAKLLALLNAEPAEEPEKNESQ